MPNRLFAIAVVFLSAGCLQTRFTSSNEFDGVSVVGFNWKCLPNPITCTGTGGNSAVVRVAVDFRLKPNMSERAFVRCLLYDNEFYDDLLGGSNETHVLNPPGPGQGRTINKIFNIPIECDADCYVTGIEGSSGESDPSCYVEVRKVDAAGDNAGTFLYSNTATITCFKPSEETVITVPMTPVPGDGQ